MGMQAGNIELMSRVTLGLAVMVVAWVAAKSTWVFLQPELALPEYADIEIEVQQQAADDAVMIRNAHLFGVPAKAKPKPKPVKKRKTSASLSQATLLGLLAEGDGTGAAVIALKGQKSSARIYHDGEELPGIGQIHSIWGDRISVNVAGQLENLYLKKSTSDQAKPGRKRSTAGTTSRLGKFRQTIRQNPDQLAKHFKARPVKRGGKVIGYSVRSQGAYRSVFREAGLRNGDIVKSVNGIELNDSANALKVYQDLRDADEVRAVVLRGGRTLTIRRTLN